MKKEDLIAMGLNEDQAKKVMELHTSVLDGNYVPKTRFNEVNEENKTLKGQISDRDKQLEDLKKSTGDSEALKRQIADLQQQNANAQKAHEAEMNKLKMDNAIEAALTAAGAKNAKAVRSLFDETGFKMNDKGEVEGLADAIKAVQKSDSYMFEQKQQQQQKFSGFQPGASGQQKPGTEVDTSKMTYSELTAYMAANPDFKLNN